jgi:hypothetical protein
VPLLVLANKNDLPDAIGVDDLIKEMRLGEIRGRAVSVSQHDACFFAFCLVGHMLIVLVLLDE